MDLRTEQEASLLAEMPMDSDGLERRIADYQQQLDPSLWPQRKKIPNYAIISWNILLTSMTSTIFAPSTSQIIDEFSAKDKSGAFTISSYVFWSSMGLIVFAPMSEFCGRTKVYHVCNIGFLLSSLGCAASPSFIVLLFFRSLAGLFGSCPIAVGPGSLTDLTTAGQRSTVLSIGVAGALIGPTLAPILGNIIEQHYGWRWIALSLSLMSLLTTAASFLLLDETYQPVLANRQTSANHAPSTSVLEALTESILGNTARLLHAWRMMRRSRISLPLALNVGVLVGYFYVLVASFPDVSARLDGFLSRNLSLTYLTIGAGEAVAAVSFGVIFDLMSKRKHKQTKYAAEIEMAPLYCGTLVASMGLSCFGWAVQVQAHWTAVLTAIGIFGIGETAVAMHASTYFVDAFPSNSASVSAIAAVVRCVIASILSSLGPVTYKYLGFGWANALFSCNVLLAAFLANTFQSRR